MLSLLAQIDADPVRAEQLRVLRAIEVLEHIGTDEANQLIQRLAKGAPLSRTTEEAGLAADRMARMRR